MGPDISLLRQPSDTLWGNQELGGCTLEAGWMQPPCFGGWKKCSPIDESQVKPFMRTPRALLSELPA